MSNNDLLFTKTLKIKRDSMLKKHNILRSFSRSEWKSCSVGISSRKWNACFNGKAALTFFLLCSREYKNHFSKAVTHHETLSPWSCVLTFPHSLTHRRRTKERNEIMLTMNCSLHQLISLSLSPSFSHTPRLNFFLNKWL